MENKKLLLLVILTFLLNSFVFAIDAETLTEETQDEIVQWQTLEWEEEDPDYVTKYSIVIEKFDEAKQLYVEHESLETKDNSTSINIEPQLAPGYYRYKIVTYDLFYLPSIESDWNFLTIYKAYEPKVTGISSINFSQVIYLEEYNDGIFTISGQNLFMPPENEYSTNFTRYLLKSSRDSKNQRSHDEALTSYEPEILSHDDNNKKLKVYFDPDKLEIGTYHFTAEDASGLTSANNSDNELIIKFKKPVDFNISVGYELPCILYDSTFRKYFESSIWPVSATAKASLIFSKHRYGFFGVQLQGNYSRVFTIKDTYTIDGNVISGYGNFVYQKPIYKQVSETQRKHILTLEAHAGAGVMCLQNFGFHFENNINSKTLNSLNISVDAGVALQIFITNKLFAEVQADYVNAFMSDMLLGTIVPSVSIGWQF